MKATRPLVRRRRERASATTIPDASHSAATDVASARRLWKCTARTAATTKATAAPNVALLRLRARRSRRVEISKKNRSMNARRAREAARDAAPLRKLRPRF